MIMELNKEEIKTVIESLIFAASGDACLDTENFDSELAVAVAEKLNDESIELSCYLFKGSDEYYEESLSERIEQSIKQIRVKK
jgi:hypothetical protein